MTGRLKTYLAIVQCTPEHMHVYAHSYRDEHTEHMISMAHARLHIDATQTGVRSQ